MPKFSETMMDHVLSPRNGGVLEQPDLTGHAGVKGTLVKGDIASLVKGTLLI